MSLTHSPVHALRVEVEMSSYPDDEACIIDIWGFEETDSILDDIYSSFSNYGHV